MDILGNVVEEAGLGQELGEPDHICVPVAGTLTPSAADPQYLGQVLLTMLDEDGTPFDVEPRNVLNRVWQRLRQRGLFPVVAVELEFYLIDRQRDPEGYLQPPCAPGTQERNTQSQVYSVDNLNHFADVLSEIDELARLQGLPADGAVAEASPGQFEVNLHHTNDVLQACDHALALKRLVRMVAEKHHMHATFMAKPYEEHAGSGMHVHISMLDKQGNNVFADADGEDSTLLKQALAGMIALMPASMALLAPNVNAYRRFQAGMYVPTQASWGHNNRTVALRIPCGDRDSHRVEYRVAGADANPYLGDWQPFWPGLSTASTLSYRCLSQSPATGWSKRGCRSRSARAMRCMSSNTSRCSMRCWANVSATSIWPVRPMSWSSLSG
ncbi:Gamma-glutamylputrescine synthetase PuuA [Serratia fonticola]|uniref:Gamma-glutamylputrescine synthetase PuuA n=1 Tax=Serratia fonticola TaxID=47917 RepID=A0A4U9WK50_SERFO|nr:Gamma-glutamylputrescine synthetase PuuA [Serratia fonticola]